MFLPFICLSAVNIGFGGSGHPRALLAVVLWLGGLFYGGMSLLCRCLRALCVVSLVYFFYLSFYRCLAVAGFAFVVCGGFCALSGCFWRFLAFACAFRIVCWVLRVFFNVSFCRWFVFFAPIFLHCWCPFLYFFLPLNVVCCVLFFSALNRCFSHCLLSFARLGGLFCVICLSLPLITHFFCFF